jgi:hypothetical protein
MASGISIEPVCSARQVMQNPGSQYPFKSQVSYGEKNEKDKQYHGGYRSFGAF